MSKFIASVKKLKQFSIKDLWVPTTAYSRYQHSACIICVNVYIYSYGMPNIYANLYSESSNKSIIERWVPELSTPFFLFKVCQP